MTIAPWHMWGSYAIVQVPHPSSSATQFVQSQQLARLNYGRPDSWKFLLAARLLEAPDGVDDNNVDVIVDFDLIVGIGRTSVTLGGRPGEPGFARIVFHYSGPASAQVGVLKWTTQTQTPDLDNRTSPGVVLPLIEFPAQDIQCSTRVTTQSASAQDVRTVVEVHSYFAPSTHLRPEWYTTVKGDEHRFRGGENGGT